MAYNKVIIYGNLVELFQYDRSLGERGRSKVQNARRNSHKVLVHDRANPLYEVSKQAYIGKRRDNARRAGVVFRRLVSANLGGPEVPLLLTFTYAENRTDLTSAYRDFTIHNKAWRRRFGNGFKYIAVPEFQERGAVHFHALYWGIPASYRSCWLAGRLSGNYANISPELGREWGHGFVFLKETDGNHKLSSYLAKYMAKSFVEYNLANQKAYVTSRNILRPIAIKGIDSVELLLSEVYPVDKSPLQEAIYSTQWLGNCRYKLYNQIEYEDKRASGTVVSGIESIRF